MKRDLYALAQTQKLYILIKNKPVVTDNKEEWMFWMMHIPRGIEQTKLPSGRELITTFMGYCGEHRESQPLTFATVFKPELLLPDFTVNLEWYFSWDEARDGHARYVRQYSKNGERTERLLRR